MLRRSHYIVLGAVILITAVFLHLPGQTAANLKLAISSVFIPMSGLAGATEQAVEKAGQAVVPRQELLDRLRKLEQENAEFRARVPQWEAMAQENARFRDYFHWQKDSPWKVRLARVIGRDPANWWRTLRIDAGSDAGVAVNAPVFTREGLVGRVAQVGINESQVVLIGDPDCRVAVMIEETRDRGVLVPATSSPLDPTLVELVYLPRNIQLRAGQRVVTSGEGGIFPKNLLVGQLVDFRSVGYGLYTEARVKIQVRMNTLEDVFVKLP